MKTMYVCYLFYFFTLLSEIAAEKNIKKLHVLSPFHIIIKKKKSDESSVRRKVY